MTTESQFVRGQDRTYFNIHVPTRLWYDDQFLDFNKRGPLEPQSEVDRQTGSGFKIQPIEKQMRGAGPMQNNFDPSVKAPVNRVYEYTPRLQYHQPVKNYLYKPLQHGGSPGTFSPHRFHNQPNPAINNWLPGTRIPEPTRTFEYSPQYQFHSLPVDPIQWAPKRGPTGIAGHMSYDDYKSYGQTQKYYNGGQFNHVAYNPMIIKQ